MDELTRDQFSNDYSYWLATGRWASDGLSHLDPPFRVLVYLHSDAVIPECDCGDREWEVQLSLGWGWTNSYQNCTFTTLGEAVDYALTLRPDDESVVQPLPPPGGRPWRDD